MILMIEFFLLEQVIIIFIIIIIIIINYGADYGTSGVRTCLISYSVVNKEIKIESENQLLWSKDIIYDSPNDWNKAMFTLLQLIPIDYRNKLNRICISGTSSTCCIYDYSLQTANKKRGTRMYNYNILDSNNNKGFFNVTIILLLLLLLLLLYIR